MSETNEVERMKEILDKIHEMALSDDHMMVPFSRDNQIMADRVIEKVGKKLLNIADLCQVGLGD